MVNVSRAIIDVSDEIGAGIKDTIYQVHFDTHTPVTFDNQPSWYGSVEP